MKLNQDVIDRVNRAVRPDRLTELAVDLIRIPSPTQHAAAVADLMAEVLAAEGFEVGRPEAAWPRSPAVVTRYESGVPGRTLQFNGHLDTVHLPFVPPRIEDGILYGSGASDMKAGVAAMCEALLAVRDSHVLEAGGILLTAHDLHEAPWGRGQQLTALIDAGYVGDAALLPEYLSNILPVVGRGMANVEVTLSREGTPVHEVLGGLGKPRVIVAGADLVNRLEALDRSLTGRTHPLAGRESVFVGKVEGGEIYNQSPTEFRLAGTCRWLPGTAVDQVRKRFLEAVDAMETPSGIQVDARFHYRRDAFEMDLEHPLVGAFEDSCRAVMGRTLPHGAKPFIDDGNTLGELAGIETITHGPRATGAHTTGEQVPVDDLIRVAKVYACAAVAFCAG
ncbi:MAG: M20/M25/M40 family metallo-hydrolase [Acidobacteriota bacterium]|nr:M20/M25/M40 family metallo-hydrolase [Acidobacteriota bacterium]